MHRITDIHLGISALHNLGIHIHEALSAECTGKKKVILSTAM